MGWFRLGFELLPAGLVGVFFGALLAIHLSTISSHLNLGALYFTRDLYQRYLRPDAEAAENVVLRLDRYGRPLWCCCVGSFFYGLMMEEITSWLIFALWLMMAGIWLPNILQVVWWRFNAWGYLVLLGRQPRRLVARRLDSCRHFEIVLPPLPDHAAVLAADGAGSGGLLAGDVCSPAPSRWIIWCDITS